MGTNSVQAMKLLSATIRKPFFQFQNQAITTINDPLYLLKWTHNLFPKYDVQFECERSDIQLCVIAKRQHNEKLYKHDKHGVIRMLYKLTDTHLSPVTQCAMKVAWLLKSWVTL
jgi:hypothetical protein